MTDPEKVRRRIIQGEEAAERLRERKATLRREIVLAEEVEGKDADGKREELGRVEKELDDLQETLPHLREILGDAENQADEARIRAAHRRLRKRAGAAREKVAEVTAAARAKVGELEELLAKLPDEPWLGPAQAEEEGRVLLHFSDANLPERPRSRDPWERLQEPPEFGLLAVLDRVVEIRAELAHRRIEGGRLVQLLQRDVDGVMDGDVRRLRGLLGRLSPESRETIGERLESRIAEAEADRERREEERRRREGRVVPLLGRRERGET